MPISTTRTEREAGLTAGADECVGRRASEREIDARIAVARRIAELEAVLRVTLAENRKLSATDDLTRLASRRFFSKHFPREMERAARYGRPLSLILCDIDLFKAVNDTLGHAGGDQILRQFGARLQRSLRRGVDWVARIGGEEFAVVLPETPYQQALEVARKLRAAVAQPPFTTEGKTIPVTASFGLCGLDRVPAGERRLAERVLKIADAALYRSKHSGRNRVTATMFGGGAGTERARARGWRNCAQDDASPCRCSAFAPAGAPLSTWLCTNSVDNFRGVAAHHCLCETAPLFARGPTHEEDGKRTGHSR